MSKVTKKVDMDKRGLEEFRCQKTGEGRGELGKRRRKDAKMRREGRKEK